MKRQEKERERTQVAGPVYTPLGARILVRLDPPKTQSAGGIHLPDRAKTPNRMATVVAVGAGKIEDDGTRTRADAEVGQRVLVHAYAGNYLDDEKRLLICEEKDVLSIVEEE